MSTELNDYQLGPIFLISVVVILAATEVGRWLGVRADDQGGDEVLTLQGACLGLLALMIAFTFAMALSRFEGRRDAVLQEANAIGTTALRARLLPEPHNTETLKLLREYVQIRLDITQRVPSPPRSSMLRLPTPTEFNSSFGNRQWQWLRRTAGSCLRAFLSSL